MFRGRLNQTCGRNFAECDLNSCAFFIARHFPTQAGRHRFSKQLQCLIEITNKCILLQKKLFLIKLIKGFFSRAALHWYCNKISIKVQLVAAVYGGCDHWEVDHCSFAMKCPSHWHEMRWELRKSEELEVSSKAVSAGDVIDMRFRELLTSLRHQQFLWQIFSELQRRSNDSTDPGVIDAQGISQFQWDLRQMKNHRRTNISVEIIERRKLIPGIGHRNNNNTFQLLASFMLGCGHHRCFYCSKSSEKRKWNEFYSEWKKKTM